MSITVYRTETIPKSQYGHGVIRIVYKVYANRTVPYRNHFRYVACVRIILKLPSTRTVPYRTVPYLYLWSDTAPYRTVLFRTVWYGTVRYGTVRYGTGTAWRNATSTGTCAGTGTKHRHRHRHRHRHAPPPHTHTTHKLLLLFFIARKSPLFMVP